MSSEPPRRSDPVDRTEQQFVPFQMAMRNQLGLLADEWMEARVELVKRLRSLISLENDTDELQKLQTMLANALISEADTDHFDRVCTKVVDSAIRNIRKWRRFKMSSEKTSVKR